MTPLFRYVLSAFKMMMIVSVEMDPIVWTRILNLQPLWRDVRASKQFSREKQREEED